ncbi:hypothetical protein C8R48DRAFT_324692 [Suillus tomentosus]|nr:hypothetical protein C8R48DRAFT_324692 [Suillus tomentosus]
MSTSNGKLGEHFLRIPKLATDGENWMMYKERLQWSIDARGLLGHLDGTETKPIDPKHPWQHFFDVLTVFQSGFLDSTEVSSQGVSARLGRIVGEV